MPILVTMAIRMCMCSDPTLRSPCVGPCMLCCAGGQRDLFEGVLQAGSLIVDRLRTYSQPVTVYIPPGAEVRGGAWVVIDSQINPGVVEMYADPAARGGVLEPEGIAEIKFRVPDLIKAMHRLDPELQRLRSEGGALGEAGVKAREKQLLPVYQQVALQFADMHDTPVRMMAKGVLAGVVPWSSSRRYFTGRLKRCVKGTMQVLS
jgi:acetyl-CoA carboxylase / biotin carboxylase 1